MAPNANDFLDASESDNDHIDTYDSDNEIAKGGSRSTKRRKLSLDEEDSESDRDANDIDHDDDEEDGAEEPRSIQDQESANKKRKLPKIQSDLPNVSRTLIKKNLVTTDKAIHKSGVVYLSRIPPFMKPAKLRSLLEPYGSINRVFLAPEDPTAHARRVKAGGNKKRSFTEGWVEFLRKKDAKNVCALLNARTVGGKKGTYYRDDLWNLLYLKGFKWHNLTEQIATENAERASRMRAEISKTSRENKEFVKNVEQAKVLDGIAKSAAARKRKATDEGTAPPLDGAAGAAEVDGEAKPQRRARTFKQTSLVKKSKDMDEQPERVTRVLNNIF
ncbi:U3 snoRNP-associated protein Esf2 [Cordyceps militaris CM01]|uniref:18S rRNA factor 2 n=1 Tax=Cordyceps militaris (strain CM01) TaxID=983644 RepID=G3JJD3_CORMM|nr:U3 snoRNP-associated protein Esf2 [Cordyceps militaris CM01]EGX91227.1 U3 snoRNP-associated protein Esf2 [Cordyceps militaris CM01]